MGSACWPSWPSSASVCDNGDGLQQGKGRLHWQDCWCEGYLAEDQTPLRNQILARYPGFFRGLLASPSKEVRLLARIVCNDPRSTTCRNLRYLRQKTGMAQAEQFSSWKVREALTVKKVPEDQLWRLGLLTALLNMRHDKYLQVQDSQQITAMIDSLSST